MAAYSSAGRVPLVIWAATVDPADVPMMRSASVTSIPASDRPAMRPSSHALPAAPPPARTKARLFELPACLVASEVVVELKRGGEEGVVFTGVAFRELPVGRSRWRLPQSRDRALQGSTHYGYCVHGSHLLPMDHDHGNDRTPTMRCAIGIKPDPLRVLQHAAARLGSASWRVICRVLDRTVRSGRRARPLEPGRGGRAFG